MKGKFIKIKKDYWIKYAGFPLIISNWVYQKFKKNFIIKDKKTGELELIDENMSNCCDAPVNNGRCYNCKENV